MIHIYTGDSKGKTTAAVGLAVRATGAGKKVLWVSYFKPEGSSEHEMLKKIGISLEEFKHRGNFFKEYTEEEIAKARKDFDKFFDEMKARTAEHEVIIHDEIVYALHMNLTNLLEVHGYLKMFKDHEIVMTGRDFPQELIELADYVTEMRKVKHPYDEGHHPREGIEY